MDSKRRSFHIEKPGDLSNRRVFMAARSFMGGSTQSMFVCARSTGVSSTASSLSISHPPLRNWITHTYLTRLVPRCSVNCESRITPLLRPIERERERERERDGQGGGREASSTTIERGTVRLSLSDATGILNKRSPESERFRALCSFRNSWRHRINFT